MDKQKTIFQQCDITVRAFAKKTSFQDAEGADTVIHTVNGFLHHIKTSCHYVMSMQKASRRKENEEKMKSHTSWEV